VDKCIVRIGNVAKGGTDVRKYKLHVREETRSNIWQSENAKKAIS